MPYITELNNIAAVLSGKEPLRTTDWLSFTIPKILTDGTEFEVNELLRLFQLVFGKNVIFDQYCNLILDTPRTQELLARAHISNNSIQDTEIVDLDATQPAGSITQALET